MCFSSSFPSYVESSKGNASSCAAACKFKDPSTCHEPPSWVSYCWWFRHPAITSWYGEIYHYLQGFINVRWCRISSINSMIIHDITKPSTILWSKIVKFCIDWAAWISSVNQKGRKCWEKNQVLSVSSESSEYMVVTSNKKCSGTILPQSKLRLKEKGRVSYCFINNIDSYTSLFCLHLHASWISLPQKTFLFESLAYSLRFSEQCTVIEKGQLRF